MPETVLLARTGSTAVVTLNRPDVLNAINDDMRRDLLLAVEAAEEDDGVRAIVIAGAGKRAFCAGADLRDMVDVPPLVEERARRHQRRWDELLERVSKPTIAAIHGFCLGGGLEMALACDVRIASSDAIFALPEVGLGLIPGAGGTQRLPRVVGMANALRIILTGERINASAALEMGLVATITSRGAVLDTALEWATRMSLGTPWAIAYAKECVRRASDLALADGLSLESDLATILMSTGERREGVKAFLEWRKSGQ